MYKPVPNGAIQIIYPVYQGLLCRSQVFMSAFQQRLWTRNIFKLLNINFRIRLIAGLQEQFVHEAKKSV